MTIVSATGIFSLCIVLMTISSFILSGSLEKLNIRPSGWRMDDQSGVDEKLFDVISGFEALSVEEK